MIQLIILFSFFICTVANELSAQPYPWNSEKRLTEGFYDSNPKFIQLINQIYYGYNYDLLVFERRNAINDSLSRICVVKIDTGGFQGVPLNFTDGTFSDRNPDICIGNCCLEIRNSLAVWESKRPEGILIAGCYFDANIGWGKPFIIDSSSDNHNPKAAGITNTTYSVVYQSGNDIIYKEFDAVNIQTIYSVNITIDDTSYFSKPEISKKQFIGDNTQIIYQQKRSEGSNSVIRRKYTSNNIWTEPEIISDIGDNRASVFLLGDTGYNPGIESNRFGNWNIFWFNENGLEGLSIFNNNANNTSLRTFLNNRITSSFISFNTYAYKEEFSGENRIILYNKVLSNDKDTVFINSIENTGLTINNGLKYFNNDFLIWVIYNKEIGVLSSLYGKSVRAKNTGINEYNSFIPDKITLSQNYPNPFNPTTNIKFSIPNSGNISLKVYDRLGKEVADLADGFRSAGTYEINFDASRLSSGIYFYKLVTNDIVNTKKMTLIK